VRPRHGFAVAAALLAGCGGGGGEPRPIKGPAKEVADVIQRFEGATRRHDFALVCEELFTTAVRKRAGGADCAQVLAQRGGRVRKPQIDIERIEITGRRALVKVTTTAEGQARVVDTIELVKERGRFRIASLGP
jgi:hypothetical protein